MKDHIRDYATDAFRFYAMNGKSAEKYKQKIYIETLESIKKKEETFIKSGISKPTEQAIIKADEAVVERMSEILDMEAVDKVLAEFDVRRKVINRAIEIVYFTDADKELEAGDIKSRVTKASIEIHADERSVYRWLKQARELFAYQRGLRIKKTS
ncbi:hypothetical protein JMF89_17280 [Clostridiaceae bacterium UIB06]|nr:hypothetical protein [Clostridiaceae bacterium UIB06]